MWRWLRDYAGVITLFIFVIAGTMSVMMGWYGKIIRIEERAKRIPELGDRIIRIEQESRSGFKSIEERLRLVENKIVAINEKVSNMDTRIKKLEELFAKASIEKLKENFVKGTEKDVWAIALASFATPNYVENFERAYNLGKELTESGVSYIKLTESMYHGRGVWIVIKGFFPSRRKALEELEVLQEQKDIMKAVSPAKPYVPAGAYTYIEFYVYK